MASVIVRRMRAADLEPARWVVFRAYAEILLRLYGAEAARQYEVRSPQFMAMYLHREPCGCFAAEAADGTLVGTVFCFIWGEIGWFGSLAVAPEWQGQGAGQALTRRAVEHLRERGCRRIGLETWPQAPLVRHLYGKFGFQPCRSTVKVTRPAAVRSRSGAWRAEWFDAPGAGPQGPPGQRVRQRHEDQPVDAAAAFETVSEITAALGAAAHGEPAADYQVEVRAAVATGWAELAILRDVAGTPAAFALCYVKQPSGAPASALDVRLLAVRPGPRESEALDALLVECDGRALTLGMAAVSCDVNLRHAHAAALLQSRGFRPIYELLRMEQPLVGVDLLARSPLIECARWAG